MLRTIKPYMSHTYLMTIYYALFHSAMSYGIIFWGSSPQSQKIFRLRQRAIRIRTGSRNTDSCRSLFKQLGVLLLKSQYILLILLFVVKNTDHFTMNCDSHGIPTRQSKNFHLHLHLHPFINRMSNIQI
jgi:hypothetical protein